MGKFVKGDIIIIPFPFSDLTSSKRRPALVLADLKGNDLILCQITSKTVFDNIAVPIDLADIEYGSLNTASNVRPNKLFTADEHIALYKLGTLKENKLNKVIATIVSLLES